uniref:F5/8 type C domain-containing protein n=1 Tax=Chlamydomonas leiostraca TaxID=1034604 RepID=A0A7S0WZE3_9CHLO|mmetsp:Transcript_37368/g.94258  ORF Transcript_37368/g.94258 Transcript_37368/m.94258 type:complete len:299 (+) Transcript_37368:152-1048(+)|eukprot:CAMPEP_0202858422 /NCGR_PEP_ID=MMETSP1391-20130828/966_1 /ASSEMBLY_ACC=CAM_ASM_000867 /TAXON_ID=1034604 /ORGANISM="Chlamydomonas leiostraca, Strain SAG 11-49" /LENGTH=298 /DNA_ID=CAMNT_0049537343 /DNA_START=123 /DNA_END=1019 /DNA_ORIENTATION=-
MGCSIQKKLSYCLFLVVLAYGDSASEAQEEVPEVITLKALGDNRTGLVSVSGAQGRSLLAASNCFCEIEQECSVANVGDDPALCSSGCSRDVAWLDEVIRAYGELLTEYSDCLPARPYPPDPMTAPQTAMLDVLWGVGVYEAEDSTHGSDREMAWTLFDDDPFTRMVTATNTYSAGLACCMGTTTTVGPNNVDGQWVQLSLPVPISLHFYQLEAFPGTSSEDQAPAQWILAGSNNKEAWVELHNMVSYDDLTAPGGFNFTLPAISGDKYRHFRLIVMGKRGSQQTTMSMSGLKFWGKQ